MMMMMMMMRVVMGSGDALLGLGFALADIARGARCLGSRLCILRTRRLSCRAWRGLGLSMFVIGPRRGGPSRAFVCAGNRLASVW